MALEKFGIKEVADVKFFNIGDVTSVDGTGITFKTGKSINDAVLTLDTLKVSTIEFTAEQSEARGGKGNAPLIIWDYGREVNVTLEDALISMDTLALLFGDVDDVTNVIEINANKFPGNYTVVGRTFARDQQTGKDHLFTFHIPNAKIQSENTITMEAEGDPTVFNLSLRVLRGTNGKMMELIADTENDYSGTDIWGTEATTTVEYVATLNYDGGKRETWYGGNDNTITLPTAAEGYKWVKAGTTQALTGAQVLTANTVFEEVSNSN